MSALADETAKIREELRRRAGDLATALLGEANEKLSNKRELRFGNRGSFRVKIDGKRVGEFADFESSERGDLFDLIQRVNGGDFASVRAYAEKFVGSHIAAAATTPAHKSKTNEKSRADVRGDMWANIWAESRDPRSTHVAKHFDIRGLTLTTDLCGEVVRFHPNLWFNGGRAPGMVALFRDVIAKCAAAKVPLSMCGEMAGNPIEAMMLIGLGFRTLSLTATALGPVKTMIRSLDAGELARYVDEIGGRPDHSLRRRLQAYARDHAVAL